MSIGTENRELNTLNNACRWAAPQDFIEVNPLRDPTRYAITFVPSGPNPRVACKALISDVYFPSSNATINGGSSVGAPVKLSEAQ